MCSRRLQIRQYFASGRELVGITRKMTISASLITWRSRQNGKNEPENESVKPPRRLEGQGQLQTWVRHREPNAVFPFLPCFFPDPVISSNN